MLKKFSIEALLVMLLFIIFTACIGILIVQGRNSYESIISKKTQTQENRIAYAYIDKKIKQNDRIGGIYVIQNPFNDNGAIRITHVGAEAGYYTTLFYEKDGLYEIMTTADETIQFELAEKIIDLNGPLHIFADGEKQLIIITDQKGNRTVIHVNSKVVNENE